MHFLMCLYAFAIYLVINSTESNQNSFIFILTFQGIQCYFIFALSNEFGFLDWSISFNSLVVTNNILTLFIMYLLHLLSHLTNKMKNKLNTKKNQVFYLFVFLLEL